MSRPWEKMKGHIRKYFLFCTKIDGERAGRMRLSDATARNFSTVLS